MSMIVDVFVDMMKLKMECSECRRCSMGGHMVDGKFLANVFSNMNCTARFMVVGQNPGREEVEKGEPMVGVSGRFLDDALESVGLHREDFYISNILRCHVSGDRKPSQEELENCRVFLDREIETLKPVLIVALGGLALQWLTGMRGIMKHHGEVVFSPRYKTFVFPMLHSSLLNMNLVENRNLFLEDLEKLKKAADDARRATEARV